MIINKIRITTRHTLQSYNQYHTNLEGSTIVRMRIYLCMCSVLVTTSPPLLQDGAHGTLGLRTLVDLRRTLRSGET